MSAIVTDGEALLRAIILHPADDDRRLVYADWLEEQGQGERAEFVRVQVAKERESDWHGFLCLPEAPCKNCRHERRLIGALWPDFWRNLWPQASWTLRPPLAAEAARPLAYFRRGFVEGVRCTWDAWQAHGRAIAAAHPVQEVSITDREPIGAPTDEVPEADGLVWTRDRGEGWPARPGDLPALVFGLLAPEDDEGRKHYHTDEAARADLSRVLILSARGRP